MINIFINLNFFRLWLGSTASGLATWGLPFIWGLSYIEGQIDTVTLGLILAVRTTGFLLILPVSGVLADRSARRMVILVASLVATLGSVFIIIGLQSDLYYIWVLLYIGAFLAGAGQGACRPAYQAIVPIIIPKTALQTANAAMSISIRVTNLVGPILATYLTIIIGSGLSLSVVALLWLFSAFIPPYPVEKATETNSVLAGQNVFGRFLHDIAQGIAEARRHPWFMAALAALTIIIALGYSVTTVLLPTISEADYGGVILLTGAATSYTLGALFGALVIAKWKPVNVGYVALLGLAIYGFVPLSLMVPTHILVPLFAYFAAGIGIELFNIIWFTSIQKEVPADKLARVSSIDFLFSYGLAPLGLSIIAPLSEAYGMRPILALCGTLCILAPLLAMIPASSKNFRQI